MITVYFQNITDDERRGFILFKSKFYSFNELNKTLGLYEDDESELFTMYDCKTLGNLPRFIPCNNNLKYYKTDFKCKFGPKRESESKGVRKTR